MSAVTGGVTNDSRPPYGRGSRGAGDAAATGFERASLRCPTGCQSNPRPERENDRLAWPRARGLSWALAAFGHPLRRLWMPAAESRLAKRWRAPAANLRSYGRLGPTIVQRRRKAGRFNSPLGAVLADGPCHDSLTSNASSSTPWSTPSRWLGTCVAWASQLLLSAARPSSHRGGGAMTARGGR
jgi:hypothetical protein